MITCEALRLRVKYYLRCLLYNKEVAALVSVLGQPSYLETWKVDPVPLAVVTSASSKPFALPNLVQFPPSITSISRSVFANSHALAKRFSAVVFLVRLFRQFGLTGRKAAWRREFPLVTIGTLRSNDADGKKNIKKKQWVFVSKTTTLHVHHAFLSISLPVFAGLQREHA